MGSERRQATRQKTFLRGCIYYNNRRSAVDCLIRDISDTGARLIFSAAVSTPDVVELYIPQKEQSIRARVHWRHGEEMGVAFDVAQGAAPSRPVDIGDVLERVEKLEAEVASMRRLLRRMKSEGGGSDAAA